MVDEVTAHGLTVHGTLPPELNDQYVRNGHNPKPGHTPTHWFRGSGMLHGLRLPDGRAEWYRNRWVRTPALEGAPEKGPDGVPDLRVSSAATHVVEHAGRILALQEANLPYEVTPRLDTVGAFDFGGALTTAMTPRPTRPPANCTSSATARCRRTSSTTSPTPGGGSWAARSSPVPARP